MVECKGRRWHGEAEGRAVSTVTIPDELIAKLRALEGSKRANPSRLVARALMKYVSMPGQTRKELLLRAKRRAAALARLGISEEEILAGFDEWRHRQRSRR